MASSSKRKICFSCFLINCGALQANATALESVTIIHAQMGRGSGNLWRQQKMLWLH